MVDRDIRHGRPIIIRHSKKFILVATVFAAITGIISMLVTNSNLSLLHADPAASVEIKPLSPSTNATLSGQADFRFYVDGIGANQYEPFWSVDNGQWNRMSKDAADSDINDATVNLTNWTWNANGQYTIRYVALLKANWEPVYATFQINVVHGVVTTASAASSKPIVSAPTNTSSKTSPSAATIANSYTPTPFSSGATLFTYPAGDVATQATAYTNANPNDPSDAAMLRLAGTPIAQWFGDWNGSSLSSDVNNYVTAASAAGQIPVLVAYNIPERDCGSYSAGGASSGDSYLSWIQTFASAIGEHPALVILEPDAIAGMDCLSSSDQTARLSLLSQAVTTLRNDSDAKIYIDAGNTNWHSAKEMASRLQQANIANADGFSLNVSNFTSTSDNISFGSQISSLVGNKHFVIDTSRNGNGPTSDNQWCNPAGRALGNLPTLQTGSALVDAYLWVKAPGQSDGTCGPTINGQAAPSSGAWWPAYAIELLSGANWE
jgi:endoglucanase